MDFGAPLRLLPVREKLIQHLHTSWSILASLHSKIELLVEYSNSSYRSGLLGDLEGLELCKL
jgi:hypothetical protein